MAPTADGCTHPSWRRDFAANGKLHEFCVACRAERRVTQPVDSGEVAQLRNGLRWIRHVAAMNSLGDTCGPQEMRALTALAEKVLDGVDLGDYDSSIGMARSKTQEWASSVGIDLPTTDELRHGDTASAPGEALSVPRPQRGEVQPAPSADPDLVIVLDANPN